MKRRGQRRRRDPSQRPDPRQRQRQGRRQRRGQASERAVVRPSAPGRGGGSGSARRGSTPRSSESPAQVDAIAAVVQRLAVLLEAGIAPRSAWVYLAEAASSPSAHRTRDPARRNDRVVASIARAVSLGAPSDQAIDAACRGGDRRAARAWRAVAAVWLVAAETGAPIAPCLREIASALREIGDNERAIDVALAAPVATARLMTVLPVAALAFGALLGFDTLRTMTTTGPGVFCLLAGSALLLLSRAWNLRLVRHATPRTTVGGLPVELMAVAMTCGASMARAQQLTETALSRFRLLEANGMAQVEAVVEFSERAGVPAAELLRSEGSQARREAHAAAQKLSSALAIRLMLPLGLCVLPAFMLLGVAPLLLSVISSTFGAL